MTFTQTICPVPVLAESDSHKPRNRASVKASILRRGAGESGKARCSTKGHSPQAVILCGVAIQADDRSQQSRGKSGLERKRGRYATCGCTPQWSERDGGRDRTNFATGGVEGHADRSCGSTPMGIPASTRIMGRGSRYQSRPGCEFNLSAFKKPTCDFSQSSGDRLGWALAWRTDLLSASNCRTSCRGRNNRHALSIYEVAHTSRRVRSSRQPRRMNLSTHTQLARSNGGLFRHPLIRRVAVAALPISGENMDTPHTLARYTASFRDSCELWSDKKHSGNAKPASLAGCGGERTIAPATTFHAGNNTGMKDPAEQVLLTIAPSRFAVNG